MRSIYLGKKRAAYKRNKERCKNCGGTAKECLKKMGCLAETVKIGATIRRSMLNVYECPSCGGPQMSRPVGFTLGGEAVYSCRDPWHVRIGQ